jgi:hypothetical protein
LHQALLDADLAKGQRRAAERLQRAIQSNLIFGAGARLRGLDQTSATARDFFVQGRITPPSARYVARKCTRCAEQAGPKKV